MTDSVISLVVAVPLSPGEIIIKTMAPTWAHARLLVDIWSMKLFVWMLGQNGEPLDSHLFFFDRYSDLADYHRLKGRAAKAQRLAAIAEAHYQAAPDDEPPEAAAMAMPVPRPPVNTNAVSTTRITNRSTGRPSDLAPSLAP
jgi:hypothetical protein